MPTLKDTLKRGFQISDHRLQQEDLALVSLRVAMKSFFSTYGKLRGRIRHIISATNSQDIIDAHSLAYAESYAECVVHFQHFAELACKSFLRNDHPLLSDVASAKAGVLHSLLHGKKLTPEEERQVRSIEFSEAISRLNDLVKSKKLLDHANLNFFSSHVEMLNDLNGLRNRIWHRGLFILEYSALDIFIGQHVLPFVRDVISHPHYSGRENFWKYSPLDCGLDPLNSIINHFTSEKYNLKKVAYLKELGRAAYDEKLPKIPLSSKTFNFTLQLLRAEKNRAERVAENEAIRDYNEVCKCPVCGAKSLIIHEDTDHDYNDEGEPIDFYRFTHAVKCEYCTLSLDDEIGNASEHALTGLSDYFSSDYSS
ncbi:hypothetical protein [Pseudomonas denitrificans (nom. rej.)]|uniref:Uncharacterized protein n=1 Tax=Pseudomonas denitrificans TaxID=43306 RepID=A0A9X7R6Y4_PSEDE|nr:hypothetical protein [Pseudomonas denitrificans (nom. rej.)]QEY75036.1 hypothetical protein F1C79_27325 [Pseudomonas denitrificans (nom. rej.)]